MNLQALARLGLFGSKSGKAKPSWWKCLLGDALYFVAGIDTGLPSVINQAEYYADVLWSAFFGPEAERLPYDFPPKLFSTIDKVLKHRGGLFDKEQESPNFWAEIGGCSSTPLTWAMRVHYAETVDPDRLDSFEASMEEALTDAGYNCNIRIMRRPLRIEIDKPNPPTVNLGDYWMSIAALPRNERIAAPAAGMVDGALVLRQVQMTNDSFSALIAGKPGSGKTQLALSLILSMAYTNSPAVLSMALCDPKVVDLMPLATLPHLAAPIATDVDECVKVIGLLVAEMDARKEQARRGDTSFLAKPIMLYVDELADLLSSLSGSEANQVITHLQRLSQTGRGYGFIIVCATQRVFDIDARAYSKLNLRFVGSTRNASDGAAATGVAGAQVHKLPGKGAFELWPGGERLQGFYVADPNDKDYAKAIGVYVADIQRRWDGQGPHWKIDDKPEPPADFPLELQNEAFASALAEAYDGAGKLSGQTVRRIHQQAFGRSIDGDKAARLRRAFIMDYVGVVDVVG